MLKGSILVLVVLPLFLPGLAVADSADQYSKCQDACFGNGLSCVKKCMGEGDDSSPSSSGSSDQAGGNNTAIVVDNGSTVDPALDPVERRRLREDLNDPQNPIADSPRAVGRPMGGRR